MIAASTRQWMTSHHPALYGKGFTDSCVHAEGVERLEVVAEGIGVKDDPLAGDELGRLVAVHRDLTLTRKPASTNVNKHQCQKSNAIVLLNLNYYYYY